MDRAKETEIINEMSRTAGYTKHFRNAVIQLLPQLQFNYDIDTIFENFSILLEVDRIRTRFNNIHSIACTWHDIGPAPYGGDFMASNLDDYNDMLVVFLHPTDASQNIGCHVKWRYFDEKTGFELNEVSVDEEELISRDDAIRKLDEIMGCWK